MKLTLIDTDSNERHVENIEELASDLKKVRELRKLKKVVKIKVHDERLNDQETQVLFKELLPACAPKGTIEWVQK